MSTHRTSRLWARPFGLEQDNLLRPMLIALGFGCFYWCADSLFDYYFFHEHTLVREFFNPAPREFVFRTLATS